uniref:C-type lectin domain-containing protein n=1 Tax=Stomoxys calcitrans TaxID=35570 RepID=A0A1I8NM55_STOCA
MLFHNILLGSLLCGLAVAVPKWCNTTEKAYLVEEDQAYNWFQALHECGRRNLQLVQIDSKEINDIIVNEVIRPNTVDYGAFFWLGGNDEFNVTSRERDFYWSPSGRKMDFSNWAEGQPDNDEYKEHCVHARGIWAYFRWNDYACDNRLGFICEEHSLAAVGKS